MTARETTLGALTAADLGKRVRVGGSVGWGALRAVKHDPLGTIVFIRGADAEHMPSTAPVTVYDEEEA